LQEKSARDSPLPGGAHYSISLSVTGAGNCSGTKVDFRFFEFRFTIYCMSARLSVVFYIILCFEIGLILTLLPWVPQGTFGILSDWGNNYFLLYAARKTGLHGLQAVVASGWVRGAVSGVGILNIGIAFWEIFHFNQSVRALQGSSETTNSSRNATKADTSSDLSDHQRRDNPSHNAGN
jgi:hypothetical protein